MIIFMKLIHCVASVIIYNCEPGQGMFLEERILTELAEFRYYPEKELLARRDYCAETKEWTGVDRLPLLHNRIINIIGQASNINRLLVSYSDNKIQGPDQLTFNSSTLSEVKMKKLGTVYRT